MSTPEEQLAAIRERRAQLAAEAETQTEPVEAALARETKALAADEALAAARKEYGAKRVELVETDEGPVVLRCPHVTSYRKFQDADAIDTDKTLELVKSCVLYPTRAEVTRMLEAQPGALTMLANVVVRLAGHRKGDLKGK